MKITTLTKKNQHKARRHGEEKVKTRENADQARRVVGRDAREAEMNKVVVISQSFFFSFPKKKVRKNHRPFTHNIPHTHTRAITHIYISLMAFLLLPFACLLKSGLQSRSSLLWSRSFLTWVCWLSVRDCGRASALRTRDSDSRMS